MSKIWMLKLLLYNDVHPWYLHLGIQPTLDEEPTHDGLGLYFIKTFKSDRYFFLALFLLDTPAHIPTLMLNSVQLVGFRCCFEITQRQEESYDFCLRSYSYLQEGCSPHSKSRTSWLELCVPNAGGWVRSQSPGTSFHMSQQRSHGPHSQIFLKKYQIQKFSLKYKWVYYGTKHPCTSSLHSNVITIQVVSKILGILMTDLHFQCNQS